MRACCNSVTHILWSLVCIIQVWVMVVFCMVSYCCVNERFAQKLKPYSVTKDILIVNKSKYLKITNVWVFSLSRLVLFSRFSLCVLWQSISSAPHQTYLLDIQFHRHQNIITKYHSQMGYLGLPSLLQAVSFTSQPPDFPFAMGSVVATRCLLICSFCTATHDFELNLWHGNVCLTQIYDNSFCKAFWIIFFPFCRPI